MPMKNKTHKYFVCAECKSRFVNIESMCSWNVFTQQVEVDDVYDKGHTCGTCGCECALEEVEFEPIESIMQNIDWPLLREHKISLLEVMDLVDGESKLCKPLDSILNLLNVLQEYAHAVDLWEFPESEEQNV